jgi:uncharacterized OB-fold protein
MTGYDGDGPQESVTVTGLLPLQSDAASEPFFIATAQGKLLLRRCSAHGHWNPPGALACERCGELKLTWAEASGLGSIEACAVVHRRGQDASDVLYTVAIVLLQEGPWLRCRLRLDRETALERGTAVRVTYQAVPGGETLPIFVIADPVITNP